MLWTLPPNRALCALGMLAVVTATECSHKTVQLPPSSKIVRDTSFQDLIPNSQLRILIPILKTGSRGVELGGRAEGNTVVLSADNLIGYELSHYQVKGKSGGTVSLKFDRAEIREDGQIVHVSNEPKLPFALPRKRGHVRLLYLVRQSQSDHNMAILASKRLPNLNALTEQVKRDSTACSSSAEVFCSWVPRGFAVRVE